MFCGVGCRKLATGRQCGCMTCVGIVFWLVGELVDAFRKGFVFVLKFFEGYKKLCGLVLNFFQ